MAKKVEVKTTEEVEVVEPDTTQKDQVNKKVEKQNKVKEDKNNKNQKKSNKNVKERRSVGKKLKESFSELKKVSWPTFGHTVKQTGVVITVVAICTLVLFGVDRLFGWLYTLLT